MLFSLARCSRRLGTRRGSRRLACRRTWPCAPSWRRSLPWPALQLGHLEVRGGVYSIVGLEVGDREEERLPLGTVTVRVASPPNVPVRKKYLLAGPIPFSWPTAANSPVYRGSGRCSFPETSTAGWAYTHVHQRAVRLPKSLSADAVGGVGFAWAGAASSAPKNSNNPTASRDRYESLRTCGIADLQIRGQPRPAKRIGASKATVTPSQKISKRLPLCGSSG